MTTGERIKEARKRAKLTQRELAEELQIPFQSISQWERDLRKPKYGTLKKLADVFGTHVYDLSSPEDTAERVKRITDFLLDGEDEPLDIPMPEYPMYMPSKEQIELMTQTEKEYSSLRLLADVDPEGLKKRYNDNYDKLNKLGKVEAVIRTTELTRLHEYTGHDPQSSSAGDKVPHSPQTSPEGKDTTSPQSAPEEPPRAE